MFILRKGWVLGQGDNERGDREQERPGCRPGVGDDYCGEGERKVGDTIYKMKISNAVYSKTRYRYVEYIEEY